MFHKEAGRGRGGPYQNELSPSVISQTFMYFSMRTLRLSSTSVQSDGAPFPAATFANDKKSKTVICYARLLVSCNLPQQSSKTANM